MFYFTCSITYLGNNIHIYIKYKEKEYIKIGLLLYSLKIHDPFNGHKDIDLSELSEPTYDVVDVTKKTVTITSNPAYATNPREMAKDSVHYTPNPAYGTHSSRSSVKAVEEPAYI